MNPTDFSHWKDTWMEYADSDYAGVSAIEGSATEKRQEIKAGVPFWTSAAAGAIGNSFRRTVRWRESILTLRRLCLRAFVVLQF